MTRSYQFWTALAAFQLVFGLIVFTVTRQYYLDDAQPTMPTVNRTNDAATTPNNTVTEADLAIFNLSVPAQDIPDDPIQISRQANEFFATAQYEQAAALYERLLGFGPDNPDTYNNLGITLHYLGRSDEALQRLNEGILADPTHQRIWLTLGFVNKELGNTDDARSALTNATRIGADESIRESAEEMLQDLP
jgi:tetratricopeptide (TPR) repeat protein